MSERRPRKETDRINVVLVRKDFLDQWYDFVWGENAAS